MGRGITGGRPEKRITIDQHLKVLRQSPCNASTLRTAVKNPNDPIIVFFIVANRNKDDA